LEGYVIVSASLTTLEDIKMTEKEKSKRKILKRDTIIKMETAG
jgi:hypothetical protein